MRPFDIKLDRGEAKDTTGIVPTRGEVEPGPDVRSQRELSRSCDRSRTEHLVS